MVERSGAMIRVSRAPVRSGSRPGRGLGGWIALPVAALALALSAGCETTRETSDGRPMPPRTRAPEPPPPDVPINTLTVLFGPRPADSNANGRPDRLSVELYMFARPYPMPVWREGTVVISAYLLGQAGTPERPGREPFHVWTLPTSSLELGRVRTMFGEGYAFQVSLLGNGGTDVIPNNALDILVRFDPAGGGESVWSDGVRSISFEPAAESVR